MKIGHIAIVVFMGSCLGVAGQQATPVQTPDALQILEKVNSFYTTSFTQLITITIAFLAFAGIILPIVFQMIQSRSFRIEQKSLQSQIATELANVRGDLVAEIDKKFESEKARVESIVQDQLGVVTERFETQSAVSRGATFFLQGQTLLNEKKFTLATRDFAVAGRYLFDGKDELNGQRAINRLLEDCLPALDETSFEILSDLDDALDGIIECLNQKNENGRFSDRLESIAEARKKAKTREKAAPVAGKPGGIIPQR